MQDGFSIGTKRNPARALGGMRGILSVSRERYDKKPSQNSQSQTSHASLYTIAPLEMFELETPKTFQ